LTGSANGGGIGYPSREGLAFGAAASVGPSVFLSNAQEPNDQLGEFGTTVIVVQPVAITIDLSRDGNVGNLSLGTGIGAGVFNFTTNTFATRTAGTNLPGGCLPNLNPFVP